MIDPLSRVSVPTKLALLFVSLCLLAYGLGGSLVSRWTEVALEGEILGRLDSECRVYATALDASLQLFERRLEDFASDGYIRDHAEQLQRGADSSVLAPLGADLRRHLLQNKLPLVDAFESLAVTDPSGRILAVVPESRGARSAWIDSREFQHEPLDGTRIGGLLGGQGEPLGLQLSTPLRGLERGHIIGQLHVFVSVDAWLGEALAIDAAGAMPSGFDVSLLLHDGRGRGLETTPDMAGPVHVLDDLETVFPQHNGPTFAPVRGTYARSFPVSHSGWWVAVSMDVEQALLPVASLKSRLLAIGIVLAILSTLLLFFPMRFVVRPLVRLTRAAEKLREGQLDTRVQVDSSDEIGQLGHSFNSMARSIQDRTQRLEETADDLQQRQGELRAERDRVEVVIASMHDGLVVLDESGKVVLSNASAQPLLALIEKGALATGHSVCADDPQDAKRNNCFACLMESEAPPRSCSIDVGKRTYEVHTTPLPPDDSGRVGRVLVSREVTDRVKHEERQIHNERLAVLGEVAAVVAHEINNPLASISMFNQMLEEEIPEDSPLRENTDVISRNITSAKRAIRELLDYATGSAPEIGPLDLHDVLHDVARFLRPLSERAGVTVQLALEAPSAEVMGDEIQLRQVFVNLTLNAIQAVSGAGRDDESALSQVILRSRVEAGELWVDVEDSGPGIPDDEVGRVFRPFFTTKSRGEGTGLGLPTARRIAELHGGSVEVAQTSAEGTTMRVRLRARTMAQNSASSTGSPPS